MSLPYRSVESIEQNAGSMEQGVIVEKNAKSVLTRLQISPEDLAGLFGEGAFEKALAKLQSLKHPALREVLDGGMDDEDGSPWVKTGWVDGNTLVDAKLEEREIQNLGKQCQDLMRDLGELASAVNFDPAQIETVRTADGELKAIFEIDYLRWFRNAAIGFPYWTGQNEAGAVRKLLETLVVQQLKPPKKKREEKPIPLVEDRSPALKAYEPPKEGRMMSVLVWLGFILTLGVIVWLTAVGMERMEENPRKEIPGWNAPDR